MKNIQERDFRYILGAFVYQLYLIKVIHTFLNIQNRKEKETIKMS